MSIAMTEQETMDVAAVLSGLDDEHLDVLCCLPVQPDGAIIREIADDVFPDVETRRAGRGRVRAIIRDLMSAGLLRESRNPHGLWGEGWVWGVKAAVWPELRGWLDQWWQDRHRVG